ncbi:MAG: FAD-dependent oxidoreductase [Clostridiales bacterium]|nr:FAD-dependent oxidoreductase [Clostridiales bacterium]
MHDIIIIGGGPAGLSAGIYAKRGGANAILLEEMFPGGQIVKTHKVENYPGFADAPEGMALGAALEAHARAWDLDIQFDSVTALLLQEGAHQVTTTTGVYSAKTLILCMGATPRSLGLPRESALSGVSYCATCDGAFYRGKRAAVVGGGDTAVSDAIYLSELCETVYLIHRRDTLRAAGTLAQAALKQENIIPIWDSEVVELLGETELSALRVRNRKTGEEQTLPVSGVFIAVGITPQTQIVQGQLELSPAGEILTNERMETSVPGVYAAGDIRKTPLRQVVTACADGAIAATSALEYLGQHK